MKDVAQFINQFPFGFWLALTILIVGFLWLLMGIKEAPAGEETENGFETYQQLYNRTKTELENEIKHSKAVESANQLLYNEGHAVGYIKGLDFASKVIKGEK